MICTAVLFRSPLIRLLYVLGWPDAQAFEEAHLRQKHYFLAKRRRISVRPITTNQFQLVMNFVSLKIISKAVRSQLRVSTNYLNIIFEATCPRHTSDGREPRCGHPCCLPTISVSRVLKHNGTTDQT